jgi:hypothetical protein
LNERAGKTKLPGLSLSVKPEQLKGKAIFAGKHATFLE